MLAVNKLSKIDETHSYGLPSIKNFEALNLNENSRMEISFNRNRSMNQYGSQTNVKEKQAKLKSENNRLRRSYSNSKLEVMPTYTTLKINFVNVNPYFDRQLSIGPLEIYIDDSLALAKPFYDLSQLIYNPFNRKPLYFFIYKNGIILNISIFKIVFFNFFIL